MKYAVAKIGGKQFKISEGDTFKIEKQGDLHFDVLLYSNGSDVLVGTPLVNDVNIKASVVGEELGKKVKVVRFKAKSRYRKTKGHRQPLSIVHIESITKAGEKPAKAEAVKTEKVEKAEVKTPKKATVKSSTTKKEKKAK